MLDKIFQLIDLKLERIAEQDKRPSVIVMNEGLFKRLQNEIVEQSMSQKFGTIRSPHSLQVYKNCKVVTSQVVEVVEVY